MRDMEQKDSDDTQNNHKQNESDDGETQNNYKPIQCFQKEMQNTYSYMKNKDSDKEM